MYLTWIKPFASQQQSQPLNSSVPQFLNSSTPKAIPPKMAPRRVAGAIFNLRRDGCVEMPIWAAEIMYLFMVYLPYSWRDIVARLRTLETFAANLDEYKLVYSFCMALKCQDPLLLTMVSYNPATQELALPHHLQEVYNGQQTPVSIWSGLRGGAIKDVAFHLIDSYSPEYPSFNEYTTNRQIWQEFCRRVDIMSSTDLSVGNPKPQWRGSNTNFTSRESTGLC